LGAINEGDDVSTLGSTLKVNTPFGYKNIESVHKTQLNPEWEIETKNGKKTTVADKHRLETLEGWFDEANNRNWTFAEELKPGDKVFTKDGWEEIERCEFNGKHSAMYDLQVADCHSYYMDDYHGHNTIWLVNLGFNIFRQGYNTVHYSMEMGEERLGLRYDGIASGITINSLMRMEGIEDVKKAYEKMKKVTKTHLKMKEFPTGAASVYDLEAHLDELELYHEFKPDAVIVDYGDIMKSTRNTKSTYEEQGWIFRELRALAIKRDVAVITATQSRRDALHDDGGTKDIIGMDQVADSMEKNRILDLLFSVQQSREEKDEGKINLWIAKNRNGESNKRLEFLINYRIMKVSEIQVASGGP
jgi:hypothetical protein